ncbi:MAG: bifunctional hexulose-6-phosphate synthase/ribonuclease regulator [Verrucomicrobia bacterium]|nr:bifunctional hexulose-6-phosphate synthase/ribonuclease regulator [Verrucomicrobiota bacterium]
MSLAPLLRPLLEFDAALLANTLLYIDPTPAEEIYLGGSIQCQTPGYGPMIGVAVTCELDSSSPGGTNNMDAYFEQLDRIREVGAPVVWVVKTIGSRPDHECVLGDGMAKLLYAAGCIGVVTDGGLRDVAGFASVPFHAFSRGRVIHHTPYRFGKFNVPVTIGGLTILPGDVLHGSAEGVIRIPKASLPSLPERAAKMRAFENEAHFIFRHPDLPPRVKSAQVGELLVQYGFAKAKPAR